MLMSPSIRPIWSAICGCLLTGAVLATGSCLWVKSSATCSRAEPACFKGQVCDYETGHCVAADASGSDTSGGSDAADPSSPAEDASDTSPPDETDAGNRSTVCGPLPQPQGPVRRVSPDDKDFVETIEDADAATTILLEAGTYKLDAGISLDTPGVTLRSASGDHSDVILDGQYKVLEMLDIGASDVTVAHLTIKRSTAHAVRIAPAGSESVTGIRLHDLYVVDHDQHPVNITPVPGEEAWVDEGTISCSTFELSDSGRSRAVSGTDQCQAGGISADGAKGWEIRHNTFRDLYCDIGDLAQHAVRFSKASFGTLVEGNRFINCDRGIGLGHKSKPGDNRRTYPDDPLHMDGTYIDHYKGAVQNNIVFSDRPNVESGIELWQARGASVRYNTVFAFGLDDEENRPSSIEYRYEHTDVVIAFNILHAEPKQRNGANATTHANLYPANREIDPNGNIFVDPARGDLHLKSDATPAIDKADTMPAVPVDIDGDARPMGDKSDIGADEYVP